MAVAVKYVYTPKYWVSEGIRQAVEQKISAAFITAIQVLVYLATVTIRRALSAPL